MRHRLKGECLQHRYSNAEYPGQITSRRWEETSVKGEREETVARTEIFGLSLINWAMGVEIAVTVHKSDARWQTEGLGRREERLRYQPGRYDGSMAWNVSGRWSVRWWKEAGV